VIVLSRTTEPANIGATCRAMKTMGLTRLRLVDPLNPKGRTAQSLAHGAQDVLEDALVVARWKRRWPTARWSAGPPPAAASSASRRSCRRTTWRGASSSTPARATSRSSSAPSAPA
jgi:hypothetical protein